MKQKFSELCDLAGKRFVAFGISSVDEADFEARGCGAGLKPEGGLSAYLNGDDGTSRMYAADYEQWCEQEGARRGSLGDMLLFSIVPDASVYVIKSWADINEAVKKYPLPKGIPCLDGMRLVDIGIDYKALSADYGAVYFANDAVVSTDARRRRVVDTNLYKSLGRLDDNWIQDRKVYISATGFEAASICVFDRGIVCDVEYMENPNTHWLDRNEAFDEATKELARGMGKEEAAARVGKRYGGDVMKLVQMVSDARDNETKYEDLVRHISGLAQVHAQGGVDLGEFIRDAMEKAYRIACPSGGQMPNGMSLEEFEHAMEHVLDANTAPLSGRADNIAEDIFAAMTSSK